MSDDDDLEQTRAWVDFLKLHPLRNNALITGDKQAQKLVLCGFGQFRSEMWLQLSGAQLLRKNSDRSYSSFLHPGPAADVAKAVYKDAPRTFPENSLLDENTGPLFQPLVNILLAYAARNTSIGYCQGFNFLAGMFLLVGISEEMSFWLLAATIEQVLPPDYYNETLFGAQVDQKVLSFLLLQKLPRLSKALQANRLPLSLITLAWFVSGYVTTFPFRVALRIWDRVFFNGSVTLFNVALAIFQISELEIIAAEDSASMYNIILKSPSNVATNPSVLLEMAASKTCSITNSVLTSLRAKCGILVKRELAQFSEERRLSFSEESSLRSFVSQNTSTSSLAVAISTVPSLEKTQSIENIENRNETV